VEVFNERVLGVAIAGFDFMKERFTPNTVATCRVWVIEDNQGAYAWTKLARVWGKHATMIHPDEKPDVVTPGGVLLLTAAVCAVPLKGGFEGTDGEWACALPLAMHTPPRTSLVLFGERRTLDVQ
jgi:hypothetical protein